MQRNAVSSADSQPPGIAQIQVNTDDVLEKGRKSSLLEALPSELIFHVLSFLAPTTLAILSATSKHLRVEGQNDLLWEAFVREKVPVQEPFPLPSQVKSWRDLYICHHPYWFLPRHKIWHADNVYSGDVMLARFDTGTASIVAHRRKWISKRFVTVLGLFWDCRSF